jgi:hypothetical protein
MRSQFDASYVFTDTAHRGFLNNAARDPGLEEVYRSNAAVVYRIR